MQTDIKSLILGAALALASVCLGEGIAHAQCDQDDTRSVEAYEQARADGAFCHTPGGSAVVAESEGGWSAVCLAADGSELGYVDEVVRDRCDYLAQGWLENDGISGAELAGMFHACMVLGMGGES